jgi:hypothetical protein
LPTPGFLEILSLKEQATLPRPSERLHRPHRFALGHMALNVISKFPPLFFGQTIKSSPRNWLMKVRGGVGRVACCVHPETIRENWEGRAFETLNKIDAQHQFMYNFLVMLWKKPPKNNKFCRI